MRFAEVGAAMMRPYEVGGERSELGEVESKSRDLESDRGYRDSRDEIWALVNQALVKFSQDAKEIIR